MYEVKGELDLLDMHVFVFEQVFCNIGVFIDDEFELESDGYLYCTETGVYLILEEPTQVIHVPYTNLCQVCCIDEGIYIETISEDYETYLEVIFLEKESPKRLCSVLENLLSVERLYPTLKQSKLYLTEVVEESVAQSLSSEMPDLKLLSGYEFEDFVGQLFQRLGYEVEQTPKSRDQGVDLILTKGDVRAAIQTKLYRESVGNSAVQEVFTGMHHYSCTHAAVLTTSSYSQSARELAESTGVKLWDGIQLEFFYKLSLFGLGAEGFPIF